MKIAIIGGGWAGIAAAVELAEHTPPVDITLFEAGRALGGRARAIDANLPSPSGERGRITLDNGQHILLGAYRETLALMTRVGVSPEQKLQRLPLQIRDNRGFCLALPRLSAPFNLAWGLFTAKGVRLAEKLSCALWMQGQKRRQFQLEQDCSVTDWLSAAGQTGVLRQRLWEPLCLAALNTPAERASAQIFAHVLRDSLGSLEPGATDLLLPRDTLSALLPEPAADWLQARGVQIRTRQRIRRLQPVDGGWQLASAGEGEVFDQVIVAVAPQHLSALISPLAAFFPERPHAPAQLVAESFSAQSLNFEPIATVYLHYPSPVALPFPLMSLQSGIGQWLVDRGQGVLAAILSGHGAWETLNDDALAAALHKEITSLLPHLATNSPPPHHFIKEQRATFSCVPNLQRCPRTTPWQGLFIAGDHTWNEYPATLESAVRSGIQAARLCTASMP
ncbi:MAG: hydroxysqualene dehydroxylase HpnE [Zoogloeaceae bacterium]|jgi:squalene-associated FAD-dependent desaturase|nr:hydroxysqualene dehydroxylase HpnE [Zoogloeaceae bacterium]